MKRVEQDMYQSGETQLLQVHANRERTSQQRVIKPEPLGWCCLLLLFFNYICCIQTMGTSRSCNSRHAAPDREDRPAAGPWSEWGGSGWWIWVSRTEYVSYLADKNDSSFANITRDKSVPRHWYPSWRSVDCNLCRFLLLIRNNVHYT